MPRVIERLLQALRRIVGAPDYEAYLDHCRRAGHPPLLDEQAYIREFFDRKGARTRCC
ncbi:MAG TPA: CstA-like transporter-associated (seleno)protein [Gemmatimonadales bacterium]|nr:CstA-like transporter-associated (seleno)protein [Gemmatimonadales bacterium]